MRSLVIRTRRYILANKKPQPGKTVIMRKQNKSFAQKLNTQGVAGYVFTSLFIIGFLAFMIIPMAMSFGFAFTRYNILSPPKFNGLDNFKQMFTNDPVFWQSFKATMYYVVFSVPMRLIMALLIALLLVRKSKASGLYRALFYLPSIVGSSVLSQSSGKECSQVTVLSTRFCRQ